MAQSVWMCAKIRVTYDIPKSSFLKQKQVVCLNFWDWGECRDIVALQLSFLGYCIECCDFEEWMSRL
ncbi:hypothetical protein V6Z11_A10G001500 [Gossypium hirsutum]